MLIGDLALVSAALFTGAAFYINFAEQPARLQLDDRSLLAQWKPAYKRGYVMQSTLAIVGFVLGAAAWWRTAVLMLLNWPWTLLGIMPTNRILMATDPTSAGIASRALLVNGTVFMPYGLASEPWRSCHSCGRWLRQAAQAQITCRIPPGVDRGTLLASNIGSTSRNVKTSRLAPRNL